MENGEIEPPQPHAAFALLIRELTSQLLYLSRLSCYQPKQHALLQLITDSRSQGNLSPAFWHIIFSIFISCR